jgi:hypothetical protein
MLLATELPVMSLTSLATSLPRLHCPDRFLPLLAAGAAGGDAYTHCLKSGRYILIARKHVIQGWEQLLHKHWTGEQDDAISCQEPSYRGGKVGTRSSVCYG